MICIPTAPEARSTPPVGRIAPSPSGRMHLGNVFAALLAWCSVRSQGGAVLLRMEDLDPERCREEYAALLREDLRWLGLDWDEEMPPQSTRTAVYETQFQKLQSQGLVYPCYCTRAALHAASAPHAADGNYVYPGTCRNLTPGQRAAQQRSPAWRVIVPEEDVSFTDGLQGVYRENLAGDCGDFIVRRSDGVFAYQLAVVTDDALGGVTQVVRGADLLSSTPRQLYLYLHLGFTPPQFYHVPLLLAPDGRRLSKREQDLDMGALRRNCKPETIIGGLAYAAGLIDQNTPLTARDLADVFCWQNVRRENITLPQTIW